MRRSFSSRRKKLKTAKVCCHIGPETLNNMIQERAYYIWEEKGRPLGDDFVHWLQAEKEILKQIK